MVDVNREPDPAREHAERRAIVLKEILRMLQTGGQVAGIVSIAGIRAAMPLLEVYTGLKARPDEGALRSAISHGGLTAGEMAVLRRAVSKALLELMEIVSVTHPLYPGAPVFKASVDGRDQVPHLVHLLALVAAVRRYFSDYGEPEPPPGPVDDAQRTIAYIATAPGEYEPISGPQQPLLIKRSAMRQRSYSQPQAAMYVQGSDPPRTMAYAMSARGAPAVAYRTGRQPGTRGGSPMMAHASGCGCGHGHGGCSCGGKGHGCSCGCGGHGHRHFAPPRLNDDGSCAPIHVISCDTRWRVRECVKTALCDALRCLGEQICEDGEFSSTRPDLSTCIERFLCSVIVCLPDAICPPPEPACCEPELVRSCGCNFAVGE